MMENQALLTALLPPPSEMEMNQIKVEMAGGNGEKIRIDELNPVNNVQEIEPNFNESSKIPSKWL